MIKRDIKSVVDQEFDLIIVGGGIYGVSMTLEAARRGLRPLLLERNDFGGETSWNSLRVLHGGLRYLQSLNIRRFRQSVAARRWFAMHLPELIQPLPCIMPLYGDGLKRPSVMRGALAVNELLGASRGLLAPRGLLPQRGRVLNMLETLNVAPYTRLRGLKGSALWYDLVMTSPQRVIIEMLHWACHCGATALNYARVDRVLLTRNRVQGVQATDQQTAEGFRASAPIVVNCAGPWTPDVAGRCSHERRSLFRPSLAFNVLLDRPPLSDAAIAVSPPGSGSPTFFITQLRGRVFAGTSHAPWSGTAAHPRPSHHHVARMLTQLNAAIPGFDLRDEDVLRVYSGLLPTTQHGSARLSTRPVVRHHGRDGGPRGLVSVSGVKFTTAPLVAARVIRALFHGHHLSGDSARPDTSSNMPRLDLLEPKQLVNGVSRHYDDAITSLIDDEAVMCLEDLTHRRTDWLADPRCSAAVMNRLSSIPAVRELQAVREPERLTVQLRPARTIGAER